jgi:hypothetical protein
VLFLTVMLLAGLAMILAGFLDSLRHSEQGAGPWFLAMALGSALIMAALLVLLALGAKWLMEMLP